MRYTISFYEMASGFPRNVSYIVKQLSNYNRVGYRVLPLSLTSASGTQTITMNLPTNSIVDLGTFALYFQASTTGNTCFAPNIEKVINRLEVTVDGRPLSSIQDYGNLFDVMQVNTFSYDLNQKRNILQNANVSAVPTADTSNKEFMIVNWLGFLGSCQPNYFHTGLVGNIQVKITLAGNECLILPATASTTESVGYTLSNISYTVDVISINDGIYMPTLQKWLADGKTFSASYKTYQYFQGNSSDYSNTTNFNPSTSSLDRIIVFFTESSAPTGSSLGSFNPTTGDNYYFTKTGGTSIYDWQFNIGGNLYPNYRPTGQGQTYFALQKALTSQYDLVGGVDYVQLATATTVPGTIPSLTNFLNFWSCAIQLDHGSDGGERYRSGLNFNGNYLGCYFNSNKISTASAPNGNVICHVHCETTCVMTIEAGKQFVVSY